MCREYALYTVFISPPLGIAPIAMLNDNQNKGIDNMGDIVAIICEIANKINAIGVNNISGAQPISNESWKCDGDTCLTNPDISVIDLK